MPFGRFTGQLSVVSENPLVLIKLGPSCKVLRSMAPSLLDAVGKGANKQCHHCAIGESADRLYFSPLYSLRV